MRTRTQYFNVGTLIVASLLFGNAFLQSSPAALVRNAQDMIAAVGVSVGVAPNPYNTIAQQLSNKEATLNQRETQLAIKESAVAAQAESSSNTFGFYSLCISVVLFILVGINFYLDLRRKSAPKFGRKFSVDLR